MFDFCSFTTPSSKKHEILVYNSQIYYFTVMDARKLLSLGMDAISWVQCCSLLADNVNLCPKAPGILVSSFSPSSVLAATVQTRFPPATSPGRHQLSVAPGRDLSHIREWLKRVSMLHPRSWSRMKTQVKTKLYTFAANSKISYWGRCWGKPR